MASGKKILIVDDNYHICHALDDFFKSKGFEVILSNDGKDGLKKAKSHQPHVIILDLMLPELPGEEVCKILKKDEVTTDIPIIMLTGKDSDVDKIVGMVIGADAYISKPFDMDKLFNEVARFVF